MIRQRRAALVFLAALAMGAAGILGTRAPERASVEEVAPEPVPAQRIETPPLDRVAPVELAEPGPALDPVADLDPQWDWDVPPAPPATPVRPAGYDARLTVYETEIDGLRGGHVSGPDGVEIVIQAGAAMTLDGEAIDGPITVRWTLVNDSDKVTAVPGNLATRIESTDVPLQSWGMVEVDLSHPEHGQIALAAPAALSFPLVANHGFDDGDRVGIYVLDTESGIWVNEGEGVVQDGRFTEVLVTRQGWWNCDAPLERRGCVRGTVAHAGWELPADTAAHLVGTEYMTRSVAFPDDKGGFCVDGMPGVEARIEAYQTGDRGCFRIASELVMASEAGTSCFQDAAACTPVVLWPERVSCDLARDAADRLGASPEQRAAVDIDLSRGEVPRGPLTATVPDTVSWAKLTCGGLERHELDVSGGSFTFERAPLKKCRLAIRDGDRLWVLPEVGGGRSYDCRMRGKNLRCIEEGAEPGAGIVAQ